MGFIQNICFFVLTTLMIFSEGATLEEKNHETILISSPNNFPTCTFLLLESTFGSDYPKLQINFPSRSNSSTFCDIEDHESPGNSTGLHNYAKFVKCTGRTIHFDADKISQPGHFHRIQINCTSSSPVDFTFGQETPFAGIEVSFGKNREASTSTAPSTWVAATFPSVLDIENEGLEKYSGDYIFFSPENPTIKVQFSLNISKAQPTKPQVQRMCLKVFENRADCTVTGSNPSQDLYFANVGGRNPTETKLLESCLITPSKSCGNKYRGTHCVQDPYCKKFQPIHQHGLIQCSSDSETQIVQYLTDLDADTRRVGGNNAFKELPQDAIIRIEKENGNSTTEIMFPDDDDEVAASIKHDTNGCITMETIVQPLRLNGSIPLQLSINEKFQVECHFIPYLLVPPVLWSVEFKNGTTQQIFADYGENTTSEKKILYHVNSEDVIVDIRSSHWEIEVVPEMKAIACEAFYWNELKVARSTQAVEIVKEAESIPDPQPAVNGTSP